MHTGKFPDDLNNPSDLARTVFCGVVSIMIHLPLKTLGRQVVPLTDSKTVHVTLSSSVKYSQVFTITVTVYGKPKVIM